MSQPYEFHCFANASKAVYAGVVYLRVLSDTPVVFLLCSKTKVAPIKTLSIPRLELCAVQLAAKLTRHFIDHLGLSSAKVHLWSDFKDVLYWLREIPSEWPTFVANRCADIATMLPDASRHHIHSADNPADIAYRGTFAVQLVHHDLWWHGPRRLRENNLAWLSPRESSVRLQNVQLLHKLKLLSIVYLST